jgi:uncharacterized membrane protein
MNPLIVLIAVFVVTSGIVRLTSGNFNYALAGQVAMSAMLLLTASGHFKFADGMSNMLPSFIPFRKGIILITGIVELLAAIGLLVVSKRTLTAWLLIVFFILVLPANISAALRGINYEGESGGGPGPGYLWFRIPLQLLFIGWVYYFFIYL